MFRYFVSYSWGEGAKFGFGNAQTTRDKKITSIEDVREVAQRFERDFGYPEYSIVILNFQLFDVEEANGKTID